MPDIGDSLGRYVLLKRLAAGGMGEVYLAAKLGSTGMAPRVAIKILREELASDPAFVEMLVDEANISMYLNHQNVVSVLEFAEDRGSYFIAMEFVQGVTLERLLARLGEQNRRLDLAVALYIAAELLRALKYAHTRVNHAGEPLNIVHRDVTPANILLSIAGEVKLTDFGIARARGRSHQTQAGVLKGKFGYLPPEMIRFEEIDARADLFCAGVVIYMMVTGAHPVAGATVIDAIQRYETKAIPRPSELNPDVPPALDSIVMRALEPKPEGRWPSASSLSAAVQDLVLRNAAWRRDVQEGSGRLSRLLEQLLPVAFEDPIAAGAADRLISEALAAKRNDPEAAAPRSSETVSQALAGMTDVDTSPPRGASRQFGSVPSTDREGTSPALEPFHRTTEEAPLAIDGLAGSLSRAEARAPSYPTSTGADLETEEGLSLSEVLAARAELARLAGNLGESVVSGVLDPPTRVAQQKTVADVLPPSPWGPAEGAALVEGGTDPNVAHGAMLEEPVLSPETPVPRSAAGIAQEVTMAAFDFDGRRNVRFPIGDGKTSASFPIDDGKTNASFPIGDGKTSASFPIDDGKTNASFPIDDGKTLLGIGGPSWDIESGEWGLTDTSVSEVARPEDLDSEPRRVLPSARLDSDATAAYARIDGAPAKRDASLADFETVIPGGPDEKENPPEGFDWDERESGGAGDPTLHDAVGVGERLQGIEPGNPVSTAEMIAMAVPELGSAASALARHAVPPDGPRTKPIAARDRRAAEERVSERGEERSWGESGGDEERPELVVGLKTSKWMVGELDARALEWGDEAAARRAVATRNKPGAPRSSVPGQGRRLPGPQGASGWRVSDPEGAGAGDPLSGVPGLASTPSSDSTRPIDLSEPASRGALSALPWPRSLTAHGMMLVTIVLALSVLIAVLVLAATSFLWPKIRLESDPPGAEVIVDDAVVDGRAPVTVKVEPGRLHSIEFHLEGHRPERREIDGIGRGRSYSLQVSMHRILPTVLLGDVFGRVIVNGAWVGQGTRVALAHLPLDGPVEIRVEADGYAPWEQSFDKGVLVPEALRVSLEKAGENKPAVVP